MATAVKVEANTPPVCPMAQVKSPAVVGKIGVIIEPLAGPPGPESGPSERIAQGEMAWMGDHGPG